VDIPGLNVTHSAPGGTITGRARAEQEMLEGCAVAASRDADTLLRAASGAFTSMSWGWGRKEGRWWGRSGARVGPEGVALVDEIDRQRA